MRLDVIFPDNRFLCTCDGRSTKKCIGILINSTDKATHHRHIHNEMFIGSLELRIPLYLLFSMEQKKINLMNHTYLFTHFGAGLNSRDLTFGLPTRTIIVPFRM